MIRKGREIGCYKATSQVQGGKNPIVTEIQTLQDNIALFTPKILDEINQIVVNAGHQLVKKKKSGYAPALTRLS